VGETCFFLLLVVAVLLLLLMLLLVDDGLEGLALLDTLDGGKGRAG
jgi:hypothetical protein